MPKKNTLAPGKYAKLIGDIRKLIDQGKQSAINAANKELILTYWKVGQRMVREGLSEQTKHRQAIVGDISQELDIDVSTLTRSVAFYQAYKTPPTDTNISWSQFKLLTPISNPKERMWYEKLAEERNLNCRQLAHAIKSDDFNDRSTSAKKKKTSSSIKRPTQASYVYSGDVVHIVDGDTIILNIDLGFDVLKKQRIRFASIDTPAMDEPGGREAYEYVCHQLKKAQSVVVKTNKIDMYGRFIGHIFYSLTDQPIDEVFEKGRYLNQELLNQGLARVF